MLTLVYFTNYSRLPLYMVGAGMFPDTPRMPETVDGTKPALCCCPPMRKLNFYFGHCKRLATIAHNKIEQFIATYCNDSYINVISPSEYLVVLYSPFL